jgi:photosystem II stability/assembly factor-like uncharacterized protein
MKTNIAYFKSLTNIIFGILLNKKNFLFAAIALISSSMSVAQWYQQYPSTNPYGYAYHDVFFIDILNGWAVGGAGAILHTSDGGVNWQLQSSVNNNTLNSVVFVDPLRGWAVGGDNDDHYLILHTDDGGDTWMTQLCDTGAYLNSVSFVDDQNGWAVGNDGLIMHTFNGGISWEIQNSGYNFYHIQVCFVNPQVGWISGNTNYGLHVVLHTQDGGTSWTILYDSQQGDIGFHFTDPLNGWIVYGSNILHTSDGGITFEVQLSDAVCGLQNVFLWTKLMAGQLDINIFNQTVGVLTYIALLTEEQPGKFAPHPMLQVTFLMIFPPYFSLMKIMAGWLVQADLSGVQ